MLTDIDSVLAQEKLNAKDWDRTYDLSNSFMIGFVIWLKYYYVPIIEIDVQVIRRTICILDDEDNKDTYGFISSEESDDPTIAQYYKTIKDSLSNIDKKQGTTSDCSEYKKQKNAKNKKKQKNQKSTSQSNGKNISNSSAESRSNPNKTLIYDMTDAMIAIYYMGIILYYLKTKYIKIFNQLTNDVKESYNIADQFAVTDIDRVNSIFKFIVKDNKINFGKEDIAIMDTLLMEDTDLAGDANVSPFFSILNTYLRIKKFMGSLVESEKESAQANKNSSHPLHLIQNLSNHGFILQNNTKSRTPVSSQPENQTRINLPEKSRTSVSSQSKNQRFTNLSGQSQTVPVAGGGKQKGGYTTNEPISNTIERLPDKTNIDLHNRRINRINMIQITRSILNKMYDSLYKNSIEPKYFAMFDVSSFKQFYSGSIGQRIKGKSIKNYIICAVTSGIQYSVAGDVIPIFWIQTSGKASEATISLITQSKSTPKVYDSSFNPKGKSIGIAKISFDQNNDMVIKFNKDILSNVKTNAVSPSDVQRRDGAPLVNTEISDGVSLVNTNISDLINELSIVVRKTDKDLFSGDVVIKLNNKGSQAINNNKLVFHCVNMELTNDNLMNPLLRKKKGNKSDNNGNNQANGLTKNDRSEIFEGVQNKNDGAYLRHCNTNMVILKS